MEQDVIRDIIVGGTNAGRWQGHASSLLSIVGSISKWVGFFTCCFGDQEYILYKYWSGVNGVSILELNGVSNWSFNGVCVHRDHWSLLADMINIIKTVNL